MEARKDFENRCDGRPGTNAGESGASFSRLTDSVLVRVGDSGATFIEDSEFGCLGEASLSEDGAVALDVGGEAGSEASAGWNFLSSNIYSYFEIKYEHI